MDGKKIYTSYRWLILMVGCGTNISFGITLVMFAPILGEIAKDISIDMGRAIHLYMAFALTMAFTEVLGGMLCDKFGITAVFVLGLLCASIPATLMPWIGHSYKMVFVARLVQGVVAITFTTIGPILALWFPPKEQGLAGGLIMSSLSMGSAIGVVASPSLLGIIGSWQKTVAILSIPGWIAIVLALLITRKPPSVQVVSALVEAMKLTKEDATYRRAFFSSMTWIGVFIMFFNTWGLYGLYNLVPTYLAIEAPMGIGLGPITAGKISLALTLAGIPAFTVGGIFFDKVAKGSAKPAIFIGFAMTGLFTYLLLLPSVYQKLALLVVCLLVAGWGMSFMTPSISAFIAKNYPPNLVGSMVGLWCGLGAFGGALGTYFAGLATTKSGNLYWAFTLISLAAGIGFILGFFLKPKPMHGGSS